MKLKRIFLRKANQAFFASGCLYGVFLYARVNYVLPFHFGPLEGDWLVLGYYVAEAALVGSFADWFAVNAVFEVPWIARLLPFLAAHTAILPRSTQYLYRAADLPRSPKASPSPALCSRP